MSVQVFYGGDGSSLSLLLLKIERDQSPFPYCWPGVDLEVTAKCTTPLGLSLRTLPLHLMNRTWRLLFFSGSFAFRLALSFSCDAPSGVEEKSWMLRHSKLVVNSAAGDGLTGVWH